MRPALFRWVLLLLLTCFLVAGCERPIMEAIQAPRACSELRLIANLGMVMAQPMEAGQLRRWIAETYGINNEDVTVETYKVNLGLNWKKDGVVYRMTCTRDAERLTPFDIRIGFDERKPPIGHLLQCLGWGDPDHYWARFGDEVPYGKSYVFDAYFLDKGAMLFSGEHYLTNRPVKPPLLNVNLPVNGVVLVDPGSLEEVYRKVHQGISLESAERPKPWPGSWDKLEYVIRMGGSYPTQP